MFDIIFKVAVVLVLIGTYCYLVWNLKRERTYSSAQDKLIDLILDMLNDTVEKAVEAEAQYNYWFTSAKRWRKRAWEERNARYQEQDASVRSINLLSDEIDRLHIEHAKTVLGATEVVPQAKTWAEFGDGTGFTNDTGDDIDKPIGLHIVDRGE